MKEEYLNYWLKNPDASDAEYQDWLHSQGYRKVTMEEKQSEHDAWWDSLTNEDKEKLYEEAERAEEERIERQLDEECLFNQWDGIDKTE